MNTWQRRTAQYLLMLVVIMFVYAMLYHYVMLTYEGATHSFLHSVQVVVETFTTTGFGSDSPWESPQANLVVIAMDITGVVLIFLALPMLLFPLFEETISTTPPSSVDDISEHVVISSFSPRVRMLVEELDLLEIPYVLIEPDRDRAVELLEDGLSLIHGDPESAATLEAANLGAARALVADIDDSTNASVVLTAKDTAPDVQCITFVQEPDIEPYHRYAGADHVFSPRTLIGTSLAKKVTTRVSTDLGDAIEIGEDFEIVELPVQSGSELTGTTVEESDIRERTGANVIGAWFRGEFLSPPPPTTQIDEQTILLVAGQESQLEILKELTLSKDRTTDSGTVVIGGYGEVGSTIDERLSSAAVSATTVDIEAKDGVDIVGDMTDKDDLRAAGVDEASTVILALSDDTLTIFATLVVREFNPDVEIIARADETESVTKLYQAGADYVLALATVSGRMLASTILGEDVISLDQQIEVVRFGADGLAGQTLAGADIRARTGCTVIAIERNGEIITDLDPDFRFSGRDSLVVAGPDDGIARFAALYD